MKLLDRMLNARQAAFDKLMAATNPEFVTKVDEGLMSLVAIKVKFEVGTWLRAVFPTVVRELNMKDVPGIVAFGLEEGNGADAFTVGLPMEWKGRKAYAVGVTPQTWGDGDRVEAFSHEMVHVRQHLSGDLDTAGDVPRWKGEPYSIARMKLEKKLVSFGRSIGVKDAAKIAGSPWEKEAYDEGERVANIILKEFPWTK